MSSVPVIQVMIIPCSTIYCKLIWMNNIYFLTFVHILHLHCILELKGGRKCARKNLFCPGSLCVYHQGSSGRDCYLAALRRIALWSHRQDVYTTRASIPGGQGDTPRFAILLLFFSATFWPFWVKAPPLQAALTSMKGEGMSPFSIRSRDRGHSHKIPHIKWNSVFGTVLNSPFPE